MTPNPNWGRWVYTSLVAHFSSLRQGIPFYIEGQNRPTNVNDFAELRVDGPYFNEISHAVWEFDILVAILIQIVQNDNDLYKNQRYSGIFTSAFTLDIPIFKYGDDEGVDDGSQLGSLSLSPAHNERIRITQFGQIQAATNIAQSSIEARYQLRNLYTPLGT